LAAHAADAIAGAVRAGDAEGIVRRLQPFNDDLTVEAITVTARSGRPIFNWHREAVVAPGTLAGRAAAPGRRYAENIPGAVPPETLATLTVLLAQAAPAPGVSLATRLEEATAKRTRFTWWLALAAAAGGALLAAALMWRAVSHLQRPLNSLIRSAERIGQGDYTRPVEVQRRDVLGELQQALERMRGRLRQSTVNKSYLHSVLNSMTDAVFVTSPDGVIKVANAASCKLLGFSEEELLGRSMLAVLEERERADFDLQQA